MMHDVYLIRREYADGQTEPWRGGYIAEWWRASVAEMLRGQKQTAGRAPITTVNLRLFNGQLVVVRPRSRP